MTMDKNDMFKQCKLTQPTDKGYKVDVAWIPARYAIRDSVVRVKGRSGKWTVAEVWGTRNYKWILANEREYKMLASIQSRGAIDD